ncbi:MAG: DUF1801 domain-containing protein [Acidobacteriota bacterium]
MANTDYQSVADYIAAQPERVQVALEKVRKAIRKAIPQAEEVISYQIAGYKIGRARVIYFAGWKEHYSLYPLTDPLIAEFQDEFSPGEVKNRTLRFPLERPVPVSLIGRIAKFRADEEAARLQAKAAKTKPAGRGSRRT